MITEIDWWPSPAKLNLFLHICGRLNNGYHELQTLFQILDMGDEIGFELNNRGKCALVHSIEGLNDSDNLIYKAAELLLAYRSDKRSGVSIHVKKNIPMGGGLGGGSSNAATVLCALNQLWSCGLSTNQLCEIGLSLGADVPVFVKGHSAYAEGLGEKLSNTELEPVYFLVATPPIHVSTAYVFQHPELPRNSAKQAFNRFVFDDTKNDCEKLVCKLYPEVANLLHRLLHYAPSRMTGTGASVFAMFKNIDAAKNAQQQLPKTVSSFVAKGLNKSPLQAKLATLVAK